MQTARGAPLDVTRPEIQGGLSAVLRDDVLLAGAEIDHHAIQFMLVQRVFDVWLVVREKHSRLVVVDGRRSLCPQASHNGEAQQKQLIQTKHGYIILHSTTGCSMANETRSC